MVTFTELMQKADEENRAIAEEEKKRGLRIGEGALAGGAQFLISSALGLPMLPAALSAGKTAIETAVTPEATPERAGLAGISAGIEKGLPYLERAETAKRAKEAGLAPSEMTKGEIAYKKPGLTLADLQGLNIPGTVAKGGTIPAVSLGRLSAAGAKAFSSAQSYLDGGADMATVVSNINQAVDIPAREKPIIIKNLKTRKISKPGVGLKLNTEQIQ
jgi:hypothetical protein